MEHVLLIVLVVVRVRMRITHPGPVPHSFQSASQESSLVVLQLRSQRRCKTTTNTRLG